MTFTFCLSSLSHLIFFPWIDFNIFIYQPGSAATVLFTVKDIFELPINREIIGKTIENVARKYSFTQLHGVKVRTPLELLDNLMQGDLAKNSLLWYLRRQKIGLFDYDEIRSDGFKQADPDWDLCTIDEQTFLEVKSSLPPDYLKSGNEKFSKRIVDELDIKITAGIRRNPGAEPRLIPPQELRADIHIQVYYNTTRLGNSNSTNNHARIREQIASNPDMILELIRFRERLRHPYFFGFCTRDEIVQYLRRSHSKTWEYADCIYWRFPIRHAKNMKELIKLLGRQSL